MHAGGWCCMHVPACIMTLCERLLWDLLMWGKKHQCEGVRDKNRICLSGFLSVAVKLPLLMWQCLYYNWGWRAFLFIASAQFAATKCLVSKRTLVFSVTKKPHSGTMCDLWTNWAQRKFKGQGSRCAILDLELFTEQWKQACKKTIFWNGPLVWQNYSFEDVTLAS